MTIIKDEGTRGEVELAPTDREWAERDHRTIERQAILRFLCDRKERDGNTAISIAEVTEIDAWTAYNIAGDRFEVVRKDAANSRPLEPRFEADVMQTELDEKRRKMGLILG